MFNHQIVPFLPAHSRLRDSLCLGTTYYRLSERCTIQRTGKEVLVHVGRHPNKEKSSSVHGGVIMPSVASCANHLRIVAIGIKNAGLAQSEKTLEPWQ
jgi:hypothetical protein